MSHTHHHDKEFPKGVLYGAGALILLTMALVGIGRATGVTSSVPESEPVQVLDVRFEDLGQGGVAMREASSQAHIATVPAGEDGFVRGVLRSLSRERKLERLGNDAPFRLTKWADGRISISDPSTGQNVELVGFGPTNRDVFEKLLAAARAAEATRSKSDAPAAKE